MLRIDEPLEIRAEYKGYREKMKTDPIFIGKEITGNIWKKFWLGKRDLFAAAGRIKKVQSDEAMNPLNTKKVYNSVAMMSS